MHGKNGKCRRDPWAPERGSRTCTHQSPSPYSYRDSTGTGCGRGQKHEYGRRDHRSFWAWEHMSAPFPLPMDSFPVCVPSAFTALELPCNYASPHLSGQGHWDVLGV